jgi:hypothetical protein
LSREELELQKRLGLLKTLRELGFYADLEGKSDRDALEVVNQRCVKGYSSPLDLGWGDGLAKNRMLHWDHQRYWAANLIDAVADPEAKPYTRALEQWAGISVGAFKPEDVEEAWDLEGPGADGAKKVREIGVSFTHRRRRHALVPSPGKGMLDLDVLAAINRLIEGSGRQFYTGYLSSQYAEVICLTQGELDGLGRKLKWTFTTPAEKGTGEEDPSGSKRPRSGP